MSKLKIGDRIRVRGWVMLKGLDEGVYKVKWTGVYKDIPYYSFCKARGWKTIARHYCEMVDCWVGEPNENVNGIIREV